MILRLALAAGAEWHAGHEAQRAVARAVAEHRCAQRPLDLGSHLIAMNGRNAMPLGVHIMHGGIEEHRQIFLLTDGGEQHAIPHGIVVIIVYALVFQQDLAQDAGFLGIGLDHVGRRAADMHADFAAGIAAKHRAAPAPGRFSRRGARWQWPRTCPSCRHQRRLHQRTLLSFCCELTYCASRFSIKA